MTDYEDTRKLNADANVEKQNDGDDVENEDQEYEVGYRNPPKHTQFEKGRSGNLKGRPRKKPRIMSGEQVRNDVLAVLEETITVNVGGEPQDMPLILTILRRAALEAAKGDYRWGKLLIDLWRQLIDNHDEYIAKAIANIIETDAKYEEAAEAHPEHAKEIYGRRAGFRSSEHVLEAFRQVNLPMPKFGKPTGAELETERSVDLPSEDWFDEFDNSIK